MSEINTDGKVSIKSKIEDPLNTAMGILQAKHQSAFNDIKPMIELVYKTLHDVKSWKTTTQK